MNAPPPRHHPAQDWLVSHASGRLAAVPALLVAAHLPFCRPCRETVRFAEALGGALLAGTPPEAMPDGALARVLARLDVSAAAPPVPESPRELAPGIPWPAAVPDQAGARWRWLAPGISRLTLSIAGAAETERAYVLRVGPGKHLPEHGHTGWEATCVLSGHFADGTNVYGAGDVLAVESDVVHRPVSGTDAPCICLIVSDGDVRPTGLLARALRPLVGV